MWSLFVATISAFGVVFVAELGDKTQLLALGFGTRHGLRTIAIGLTIGYAAAGAVAAVVGGVLGATIPDRPVNFAAGAMFLIFAVLAVRDADDDGTPGHAVGTRSIVASIALTIVIAEMGDKTQLATVALAARANPVATWIGATGGEVAAGMLGAVAGRRIGDRIDSRLLRFGSAALFGVFGLVFLALAL